MAAAVGTNVEVITQGTCPTSSGGAKNIINVFHFQLIAGAVGVTEAAFWTAFNTNVWTPIAAALSVAFTGQQSTVRFFDDATRPAVITGVPASGATAGTRLDLALSAVVIMRTGMRGKNFRGRKSFGPVAESHATSDELNAAGITAYTPVLAALEASFVAGPGTYAPSILSRTKSILTPNPTNIINTPANVAMSRLNKTLGTMRRRKEKTNF